MLVWFLSMITRMVVTVIILEPVTPTLRRVTTSCMIAQHRETYQTMSSSRIVAPKKSIILLMPLSTKEMGRLTVSQVNVPALIYALIASSTMESFLSLEVNVYGLLY